MVTKANVIYLVYDKQCPACDYYCQIVRIRKDIGRLIVLNARDDSTIMKEITALGLDIDQGMVLKINDRIYYGADAIHTLALMSSKHTLCNKLHYWLFSSPTRSKLLYPLARTCRNMLLHMLGVTTINNLNIKDNDTF